MCLTANMLVRKASSLTIGSDSGVSFQTKTMFFREKDTN